MGNRPKFEIGQVVVNKVERIGSYEPSTCQPFTKLIVDEVRKRGTGLNMSAPWMGMYSRKMN